MDGSKVPAVRVIHQIMAERRAKLGNVGGRKQEIVLGNLNTNLKIVLRDW